MVKNETLRSQFRVRPEFAVQFISILVAFFGIYIIADSLLNHILDHRAYHLNDYLIELPILVGISVIYLATLLRKRKRTAWTVTVATMVFYLGFGVSEYLGRIEHFRLGWLEVVRDIIFPAIVLAFLFRYRDRFVVKSDIAGFRFALRFILVLIVITLIYGTVGFELMDDSDFHQEIGVTTAVHYTVDQFNITTEKPIVAYTKRAHLFLDSLRFISVICVLYALLSLFQPLKARFSDQTLARDNIRNLLDHYGGESEEFFKYWPEDKQYYFDEEGQSAIAYHVMHGVALALGDPIGNEAKFKELIEGFLNQCFYNDWLPSFIHVGGKYLDFYESDGFTLQKLGQEAMVDMEHFQTKLAESKYFRQIQNKFNKQNYSFELLNPPHQQAVLDRLRFISDDWLSKDGRGERGFAMGYYSDRYMQMSRIGVARDGASTIQAFINILPTDFNREEVNYDLLRQSSQALGNVNDYLLMNVIATTHKEGFRLLNMGLSPLAGIKSESEEKEQTLVDNVLKFAYNNGDRFFSFSGLYRFKAKYEPMWQDKYVVYRGGLRGFSRTMAALTRLMSKSVKKA
ncbi:MAG TPA: phosphatidylglycerol lysyltransferase domain-containing protein [Candidatus Sulfotelmatobacter sp.]|nr:phosphatidylglycerol lysyltransferase domain-containing protein [Candidatus Sulfotelmatobacter sp.]